MTKILLVEDDKSLREIYGVRLLAEGYEIASAGDGEEALAMAIKERPGLIISDVMMPKISGFDMLDILRSTTETKDIKVIMMTALSSEDQRARGEALGADRYLVKSQVGIEDVVRTVHEVLADGIATPKSAAQTFGVPAPTAVTPPADAIPTPEPVAAPQPAEPTPLPTPTPTPEPAASLIQPVTPSPVSSPVINSTSPAPVTPSPFQPAPNPLPQPTAPFSSNGPASLADRVIKPLSDQPAPVDMGNLMSQELSGAAAAAPVTPPPAPEPVNPLTSQPPTA